MAKKYARLQVLADYLRTITPKQWRGESWGRLPGKDLEGGEVEWTCKTQACALGHATQIPAFKRAGLKLNFDFYDEKYKMNFFDL